MDPGISVAVGHIEVTRGRWHQLRWVVERPGGPGYQVSRVLAAGVRVDPMASQHLDRLSVQCVYDADRSVAVGDVDHVVGDMDAMGELE